MVNLVDFSDTQFLVPCTRCAELLQDGDRFCRFCGEAQWEGAEAAYGELEAAAGGRHALPYAGSGSAVALDRATAARRARPQFALVHRGTLERQGPPADTPPGWMRNSYLPSPLVLGLAAAVLVLFAGVLVHDLYTENQRESERLLQLSGKLDEMTRAMGQGELATVERTLDTLGADSAGDPRVQALRQALDQQQQPSPAPQAQKAPEEGAVRPPAGTVAGAVAEAATTPVASPAAPAPATAPAPAAAPATAAAPPAATLSSVAASSPVAAPPADPPTPAAEAPTAAAPSAPTPAPAAAAPPAPAATAPPAPADGVPQAQAKDCNQALAALSLCRLD